MVRFVDGQPKLLRMCNATLLRAGEAVLRAPVRAYVGKVSKTDVGKGEKSEVTLEPPLPPEAECVGQTIHFLTQSPVDTSYVIKARDTASVSTVTSPSWRG